MQHVKNILTCLLLLSLTIGVWQGILAVREYRAVQQQVATDAHQLAMNTDRRLSDLAQNASGVLIQAGLTLDTINTAAQAQRQHWERTSQETAALVSDARTMLATTDENINGALNCRLNERENGPLMFCERKGGVLPELAQAVKDINTTQRQVGQELVLGVWDAREQMDKLGPVLDNAASTLKGTSDIANDPMIPYTLENIAKTSEHVEQATERALKPAKWFVTVGKLLFETSWKIATVFK